MQICKFRDLSILNLGESEIVIACDSCCGIGEAELDSIKAENHIVGYFSARVCLFELLAFNTRPHIIVDNLGMPMGGKGEKIIDGINKAVEEYNEINFFDDNFTLKDCVTGSTEDNFKTLQTFLGLTIIGKREKNYREAIAKGDKVFLLGMPKVGIEVLEEVESEKREIVSFKELKILTKIKGVKDILPIGSKGALYEINQLEESNNIIIDIEYKSEILKKSAGPATALVFICSDETLRDLNKINIPMVKIGKVI